MKHRVSPRNLDRSQTYRPAVFREIDEAGSCAVLKSGLMGKPCTVDTDSRQLASRREWLELSRKQIAEFAGIPVCAIQLLEVGHEVSPEIASAYERSLDKLEFRRVMTNLP